MDFSYLIFNTFVFGAIFGWSILALHTVNDSFLNILTWTFGPPPPTALPEFATRALITLVLFFAYELGYWFHHYLCHHVRFLWEFHKVHHTANVLTPLTVFRVHPVDTWLFVNILALAMGCANSAINYALGARLMPYTVTDTNVILVVFIHAYLHFQHTHLWISFRGLWGHIFLSPAHHQIHHSNDPAHFNTNLGSCLAIWDWLFGTLYTPGKVREPLKFGVEPNGSDPQTITEVYLSSFSRTKESEKRKRLQKRIKDRLFGKASSAGNGYSAARLQATSPQDT